MVTDPHFRFGFQTEGSAGAEDFRLWLAFENHTGEEIEITGGSFRIGTQVRSGWVNMPLTPAEPFPLGRLAGPALRFCLIWGADLPPGRDHAEWAEASRLCAYGSAFPWKDCRTVADLMAVELCELEASLSVRRGNAPLRHLGDRLMNTRIAEGRTAPPGREELVPQPFPQAPWTPGPEDHARAWRDRALVVACLVAIVVWLLI